MPKCATEQITNPATGRCVKLSGKVGQDLVKQYKAGKITLAPEDHAKIAGEHEQPEEIKAPETPKQITPPKSHVEMEMPVAPSEKANEPHISGFVKELLRKRAKEAKSRLEKKELETLKAYCKASPADRNKILLHPYTHSATTTTVPVYSLILPKLTDCLTKPHLFKRERLFSIVDMVFKNTSHSALDSSLANLCGLAPDFSLDLDWVFKQNEYIASLPLKLLYTAVGYTFQGDVMANNYMRGKYQRTKLMESFIGNDHPLLFQFIDEVKATKDFAKIFTLEASKFFKKIPDEKEQNKDKPVEMMVQSVLQNIDVLENHAEGLVLMFKVGRDLNDDFWKRVIARYCEDLQSIIRNAPPIGQMMKVYRGVKNDHYLKGTVKQTGFKYPGYLEDTKYYRNDGFVSTTIDRRTAEGFLKGGKNKSFNVITLLPGARCLMLFGATRFKAEYEVLLGLETVYLIRQKNIDCKLGLKMPLTADACQSFASENWSKQVDMLKKDVKVSDIVVVK